MSAEWLIVAGTDARLLLLGRLSFPKIPSGPVSHHELESSHDWIDACNPALGCKDAPPGRTIQRSGVIVTCPFRKFDPVWIRVVRQNHRIIRIDVCDPALARNVRRRLVQVAVPA